MANKTGSDQSLSTYQLIALFERTQTGIVLLSNDNKIESLNRAASIMLGAEPNASIGRPFWDTFPELASFFYRQLKNATPTGDSGDIDGYYPPAGIWLSLRMAAHEHGKILFISNIDEKVKRSKNTHRQEAILNGIVETMQSGIITIDTRGTMLSANRAVEVMSGFNKNELIGQPVSKLMSRNHAEKHDDYLRAFIREGKYNVVGLNRNIKMCRKDGVCVPIEISVSIIKLDGETIFVGSLIDITDRERQQQRIIELARFPEETWNPVLKMSSDGRLVYTNSRCRALLDTWEISVGDEVPEQIRQAVNKALAQKKTGRTRSELQQWINIFFVARAGARFKCSLRLWSRYYAAKT